MSIQDFKIRQYDPSYINVETKITPDLSTMRLEIASRILALNHINMEPEEALKLADKLIKKNEEMFPND